MLRKTIYFFIAIFTCLTFSFTDFESYQIFPVSERNIPGNLVSPEPLRFGHISAEEKNSKIKQVSNIDPDWQESVFKNIEKEEYNIVYDKNTGIYNSPNRKNNIIFQYGKEGFTAKTMQTKLPLFDQNDKTINEHKKKYKDVPEFSVSIKLSDVSCSSEEKTPGSGFAASIKNSELKTENNTAHIENENIRINYTNTEDGMRQDFIIKNRPEGEGMLKLNFNADTRLKMIIGADALMFKDNDGSEKMKYSALKVWDAKGRSLRAYFKKTDQFPASGKDGEIVNFKLQMNDQQSKQFPNSKFPASRQGGQIPNSGSFSIVVNDEDAVYPVTIDPLSTSPSWVVNFGYSFGSASSAAGDVNGDGYGDVIVGAKEHTTNFTNDGKVYLFLGSASGLSVTPAWTGIGANQGSNYGHSIATAGDVNGDGYSDVIIGEPGFKVSGISRGKALLYLGSSNGLSVNPDWTATGTSTDLGRSVSTAGDVNGDGYSDVIVSTAYGTIDGGARLGAAFLYTGSASGLSSSPVWQVKGKKYFENFGNSVCTAGDVNGDGYSDVIVGAPDYSETASSHEGAAYAYFGSSIGLSDSVSWFKTGGSPGDRFGYAVFTAGDVNGDGFSDVVVGAPTDSSAGNAYVYHGSASGLSGTSNWNVSGSPIAKFGFSVATAGDFNGDGYSDVIIGAVGISNGQAFVFSGSSAGLSANSVWSVTSDGSAVALGFSVCTAGDVNGDGYSDALVCGYSPKAYVYNGSPSGLTSSYNWSYSGLAGSFGWTVAGAGDINGDGYSDVIIGAPDYYNGSFTVGRFFIFNGSSDGLSSTPSFMKSGSNSGTTIYRIGRCAASAGDVNGDGYSDVAVGVSNGVFASYSNGGVEVYYGSASGISASPSWSKSSGVSQDEFGSSVATAGDLNGDGFSDIIAGAWKLNSESGAAYVFYGSQSGLSSDAGWTASGSYGSWYGYSVSGAGDVNGDGYGDVVVGAPLLSSYGGAYVYHGSSAGLSASPNWQFVSFSANSRFGISVACAGDVNGDGFSDVLMGQSRYQIGAVYAGAVSCYYGSPTGLNTLYPEWFVTAPNEYNAFEFGGCVASAGDVNGDGYSDVLVSAPNPFGDVYFYYGSANGLPLTYNLNCNNAPSMRFGYSAASAGDVNGDGYSDVIIGAYFSNGGSAYLYNGNSSSGKSSFVQQYKPNTNTLLGTGGWTGADGQAKYGILGRSPFGRADGKLMYEHRINGTSFSPITNTSGSGTGSIYQDLGLNGTLANANATGLNSDKEYRWKARVQFSPVNNPYQKLAPWRFYNSQFPLPFEGFKPRAVPVVPLDPAFALNFDGANDYVSLPDTLTSSLTGGSAITIEYLFKGTDIKSAVRLQNANGFIISGSSGNHVISSDGGLNNGIPVGSGVTDGQWHHIVVTWERNKVNGFRSYLDGLLVGQRNSADADLPDLNSGGTLGGSVDGGEYMNGSLDEVRLWNRSMTEEEVQYRSFCVLNGRVNGLLASYHFNQGYSNHNNSGITILYDSSQNSYNGTLNNFALQGVASNWIAPGGASEGFVCSGTPTLILNVIQQGYYNTSGNLNKKDTVTVYLHSNTSPYNIIDSARSLIDSVTFSGTFSFLNAAGGNYYFSVKHRNCIETWSSYDETFNSWTPVPYSLTFGTYSAYGGNLAYLAPNKYAIFSGDINQDGTIDASDVSEVDNDAYNSLSGYVNTDVTGDDFVDAGDVSIVDNNAFNSVSAVSP